MESGIQNNQREAEDICRFSVCCKLQPELLSFCSFFCSFLISPGTSFYITRTNKMSMLMIARREFPNLSVAALLVPVNHVQRVIWAKL